MAGISLEQAQERLDAYLAAEVKILAGQSVSIDGQSLTRANLDLVQRGITTWDARVKQLSARTRGRGRMRTIAPQG